METRVTLLDGGAMEQDGMLMFWMAGPSGPYRFPVYSVLIEHAEGRFLFDSGVDKALFTRLVAGGTQTDDANVPGALGIFQSERQTLPGQLDLLGLAPRDITYVMNSHYHLDHVGGNALCCCATTLCHQAELDAINHPHPIEAFGYSDNRFLCPQSPIDGRATDIYTPRFEALCGDVEVAKGLTLLETPGHTPGHYSLLVRLARRRPMLFTGDACYSKRNLDIMAIPGPHVDPKQAYGSLERLKQLADLHDAELFYSHDRESWPNYVKAPGSYV